MRTESDLIKMGTQALKTKTYTWQTTEPTPNHFQTPHLYSLFKSGLEYCPLEFNALLQSYSQEKFKTALTAFLAKAESDYQTALKNTKSVLWERFKASKILTNDAELNELKVSYLPNNTDHSNTVMGINNGLDPFYEINDSDSLELTITPCRNIDAEINAPITPKNVDLEMAIIELFNECCFLRFKGFEHTFTEYSTGSVFNKAHQHAKHLLSASSDKKAALQDLMSEEPKNQLDCWHSPKLLFAKHIGYTKAFTELESIEPLKLSVFIRENTSPIDAYLTRDIGGYVSHSFSIFKELKEVQDEFLEDCSTNGEHEDYEAVAIDPETIIECINTLAWNHALASLTLTFLTNHADYLATHNE